MNNFLIDILNVYTTYGLLKLITTILLIIVPTALFYYFKSNSKRILFLTLLSQLAAITLFLLFASFGNEFFTTIINGYNRIGLLIVLVLNNLNLAKYTMDYSADLKVKSPDPDRVNREHFKTSLNTIITLMLLGSIGLFMPSALGQMIICLTISSVLILGINHLVIRKLFVDENK